MLQVEKELYPILSKDGPALKEFRTVLYEHQLYGLKCLFAFETKALHSLENQWIRLMNSVKAIDQKSLE